MNASKHAPTHRATTYTVYPTGYDEFTFTDKSTWTLTIEERGEVGQDSWAVKKMGSVLNSSGEWEYEPSPSNREDDFLSRCRFPLDEALRLATAAVDGVVWNGVTAAQADVEVKLRLARDRRG